MSYFKKARNYTKSSTTLDEKIAKANREYEKTGVDSVELVEIANSTSGVYYAGIDHPEEPPVQSDVPDSNGFRSRDPSLPAENASDIDPSDPSTWETGGQGMDHLINPNDLPVIHGDNGIETQSTVKDQPILLTPDLTGFKGLRVDPNGDVNDMGKYGGMAYTYNLGVWGRTEGVIGPGNKFVSVLAAFGWPTGPLVDSGHPDYPSDRAMFGFYRYDDNATYAARLKMKALYANGLPSGSWKPVKCWMPFNSYGFGQTWTQYTSNPNNIWRSNGDAYITVHVFDGANQYNSSETVPPYTTVIFKDDIGKGENLPIGGLLGDLIGKLFGIGGSAADELAWGGGNKKNPKWPKPGTLSGNRVRTEAGLAQDGSYPGGPEAFYDKYGYTPQEAIDAYNNGGTPPDQSSTGGDIGDVALNDGPSSPIKYYPDAGGYLPNAGGGRPGNVRPKGSAAFPQASAGGDGNNVASSQTSPFPSDPASDASSSLGVKDGDQLAWGGGGKSKEQKALDKKFKYFNDTSKYNTKQKGDTHAGMIEAGMGIPVEKFTDTFGLTPTEWQNPENWLPDGKPNPDGPGWNKYNQSSTWTPSSEVQVASAGGLGGLLVPSGSGSGSTGQLNLPSWFSGYGNSRNAKLDAEGRIYGYNYSGGYGYLTRGPGSGDPGTPESGYGTKGFDWDTQSGGTSWTFTRHDPSKVASGEGGSPGQPYVPPKEDPKNPWVPAPGKEVAAGPGYIPPYVQDWEKLGGGGKNTGTHPWEKNKKNSKGGKIQASSGGSVGDVALNQGPSTPVKNYDGKFLPNMGGGRPGNVRPKGSAAFPQASAGGDGNNVASSQTSPFPSDPASDASSSLGVKDGDQLAWGGGGKSKEQKALDKKFKYFNDTSKYNTKQKGDTHAGMIEAGMGIPVEKFTDTFGLTPTEWQNPENWLPDGKPNPDGPGWNKYNQSSTWTPSSEVQVASAGGLGGLLVPSGSGSGSTGQLNLPSWFSGYGNSRNAKLDAEGRIYGYNYSGGYGYLTRGPGSGDPGTPESGYGTKGFDWDTQSGGTSWTFTRHDPSKVASGEGGSPGQPYVPPKEDPKNPWVPAPGKEVAAGPGYIPPYVQDWEKLGGGGKNTGTHPWEKNKKNSKGGKIQASSGGSVGDVALNQGPSTPVKNYDGKFLPNMGGGRPGNIRPKGGAAFPQAKKDSTGRGGKGKNYGMGSAVVSNKKKKNKNKNVVVASNEITGVVLNESNLLMEKNYLRDLREKKREKREVGDKVMKINITGPKDHLTVKAIDMLRQYKVSEREMQEYASIISDINQWIRENPKEYAIWKVRYPANDPRLAELNWRLDQQLKASDEYMDSHFPENERLFGKLRQKIATNVDITDPRNFKDVKPVVTHKKLLQVSKALEESKQLDKRLTFRYNKYIG